MEYIFCNVNNFYCIFTVNINFVYLFIKNGMEHMKNTNLFNKKTIDINKMDFFVCSDVALYTLLNF